jgi:ubiquinone/menaquinone biosynthesis C-methylase UbiE
MAIDYNKASKTFDNTRAADDEIIEIMANNNVFIENHNILDFGCGTGNYLLKISQKYKCNYYGLEPSEGMRKKAITKNPNIKIIDGNHEKILFENDFFDFIYIIDVIHYIKNLDLLFRNLSIKLKDNGKICIKTQTSKQIETRWFNKYFPSLENSEKERGKHIEQLEEMANKNNLILNKIDIRKYPNEIIITEHFIKNAEEKNFSMFEYINENEYKEGLEKLKNDAGKVILQKDAGESLFWLSKATRFA